MMKKNNTTNNEQSNANNMNNNNMNVGFLKNKFYLIKSYFKIGRIKKRREKKNRASIGNRKETKNRETIGYKTSRKVKTRRRN